MESHARELDLDRLTKMNRGLKYINVSAQVLRSITGIFLNNLSNKIPMAGVFLCLIRFLSDF
jgi:cation transporter-like permease